jgi:outer membrane protein OmpA-like peptidoglycan-associated protein/tetratricopeptide (TPR) repeat protein
MKMRYLRYVLIVATLLVATLPASAQNIKKAQKLIDAYQYAEAIPILENIVEKEKKNSNEAIILLADCHRMINDDENAAVYYSKAAEQEGLDPLVHLYYGQTLRTLERYDEAEEQFRKYATLNPDDKRGEMLAEYCDKMAEWIKLPDKYNPKNVPSLNSPYADFSPVFYRQGVIITTDRPKDWKKDATYEWTGKPYFGLMFSWLKGMSSPEDPIYAAPEKFDKNLDQKFHDGPVTFSPDGNFMFFSRTLEERVPKDKDRFRTNVLKMYFSYFDGENWSDPEPFFLNSNEYSVGHPALSPDGNTLYFASNMPEGHGGTDIWVCKKHGEAWSEPENLGPEVNTIMDEVFPSVDADGTLYFASEGHMGYGGLDIFYTEKKKDGWGEPVNMMKGINTSHDDFGIYLSHDLGFGLLSSNRPGGQGSDDIYAFELGPNMQSIIGNVVDDEGEPVPSATIFLLNQNHKEVLILRTGDEGTYSAWVEPNTTYTALVKKTSYIDACQNFYIADVAADPEQIVLMPYEVNQVFTLDNIYYDKNKYYIRPDAEPTLDKLVAIMREHPIAIELGSHTDSQGTDEYNMLLSQRRAESAIRYLVLNGINSARVTAKGYGETMLLNDCTNDVECTDEEHQINRRTEFKVTSVDQFPEEWSLEEKYIEGEVIPLSRFGKSFFDPCKK